MARLLAGRSPTYATIPGQVIDAHGEQDGAIYQGSRSVGDFAPVGLLAEDRADVLSALSTVSTVVAVPTSTPGVPPVLPAGSGALVLTAGQPCHPHEDQPEPELRLRPRRARGPMARGRRLRTYNSGSMLARLP